MKTKQDNHILIGNSFPLSLVRRHLFIRPLPVSELRRELSGKVVHSFWGHPETARVAGRILGRTVKPSGYRPAVTLNEDSLPMFDGLVFSECWLLTPIYPSGFRPTAPSRQTAIQRWQALHLQWQLHDQRRNKE